jgi:hypothetical protein
MSRSDDKIYLEEIAIELDRAIVTIRSWVREGFPDADGRKQRDLMPHREGGRNKIYWERVQVDGLKTYAAERSARRGWQPAT